MNADRMSAYRQWDLSLDEALRKEFEKGFPMVELEGRTGAARFARGAGRGGNSNEKGGAIHESPLPEC